MRKPRQVAGLKAAYGLHSSVREDGKQRTRQRLLKVSRKLFETHGYVGTTIDLITAHANVGRATFYLHFPSKFAVVQALIADFETQLLNVYGELAAFETYDQPTIANWINGFLELCDRDRRSVLLAQSAPTNESEFVTETARFYQAALERLGEGIPAFAVAARNSDPLIRGHAILIMFGLESLLRYCLSENKQFDRLALASSLADQIFRFIESHDAGR